MVHRHTEYKIKYYVPNEETSKKMWLENIKFRKSRRAMDLADHYWDFQVTNDAFCCEDCLTAPSKCNGKGAVSGNKQNNPETPPHLDRKEKESNKVGVSTYREASVQTPNWVQRHSRNMADLKKMPLSKSVSKSLESIRNEVEVQNAEPMPIKKSRQSRPSPESGAASRYSLSRTTKSLHRMHDLQGPFFPFGWNDDNKNVGDMKTFNVLAPTREVHPPAIMAMRRRREQVKKCTLSKDDKKQKSVSLISIPKINHSSIWITEYKEKFSKNPMTAR